MKLKEFSNMLHRLRSVEQKLTKEFENNTGFSLTRYEILIFLRDNGSCLQTEIADYLDIDRAAITRHLKILEEKNYVSRNRNEKNAREVIVSLTDFARAELLKCKESNKECNLPLPVEEEELGKLVVILERIEERLENEK